MGRCLMKALPMTIPQLLDRRKDRFAELVAALAHHPLALRVLIKKQLRCSSLVSAAAHSVPSDRLQQSPRVL